MHLYVRIYLFIQDYNQDESYSFMLNIKKVTEKSYVTNNRSTTTALSALRTNQNKVSIRNWGIKLHFMTQRENEKASLFKAKLSATFGKIYA